MALEAVLFDMDGVIVDTEPLHRKAYFRMFSEYGLDISNEYYTSFAGAATTKICGAIQKDFQLNHSVEEMMATKRAYFKEYFNSDSEFDLMPGVLDLIRHYHNHGLPLILATSATTTSISMIFNRFDLDRYFKGKISGADLEESKPNPEIFTLAAEMSGKPKENCMVIEDSTNGIQAAHGAGIFCAVYNNGHTELQDYELADIVVSNFDELRVNHVNSYFKER